MPVLDNRKNESLNFMDYALQNLENMSLDDVQLSQCQTKPHYIANMKGNSNQQNQIIYEEYINQLEENLSRTRNQRQATLFPECFEDEELNFAQLTDCEPTSVQRLAECAQVN